MTEEILGHLEAVENGTDMHDMRLHLAILERSQLYFGEEEWKRYQAASKRFRDMINALFAGSMGS